MKVILGMVLGAILIQTLFIPVGRFSYLEWNTRYVVEDEQMLREKACLTFNHTPHSWHTQYTEIVCVPLISTRGNQ